MPEQLLIVVAEAIAKPGKRDELRAAMIACIAPTRAEAGCVQYDLHEATDEPGHFLFYERWRSKEALDEHMATPHLLELFSKAPELVASEPRISTFHLIA